MRILLVSDIHANWPALRSIQEPHDICLCLGDIVEYGLEPAACVDWVRCCARYAVRGNHDHNAVQDVVANGTRGFPYLTVATRPLTRAKLNEADRRFLSRLPLSCRVTIDKIRFHMVHATPRDPLDEYARSEPSFWERRLEDIEADFLCVGHTHHPFVMEVGKQVVVNPGSVGLPRDGDPRGSYALIDGRDVQLKRFDYPIGESVQTVQESSLAADAKELLIHVYRTGGLPGRKP